MGDGVHQVGSCGLARVRTLWNSLRVKEPQQQADTAQQERDPSAEQVNDIIGALGRALTEHCFVSWNNRASL